MTHNIFKIIVISYSEPLKIYCWKEMNYTLCISADNYFIYQPKFSALVRMWVFSHQSMCTVCCTLIFTKENAYICGHKPSFTTRQAMFARSWWNLLLLLGWRRFTLWNSCSKKHTDKIWIIEMIWGKDLGMFMPKL